MPFDAGFCIFNEFTLLFTLLPNLKKEKGFSKYDFKPCHAGNTIARTAITILQSCLSIVAINCVFLFHTYLLVPRQSCSRSVFSSRSHSLASSEFSVVSSFFNLKTEPGISECY